MSPWLQTCGHIGVFIAALIYAIPLQHLLWEISHKRNDSASGLIAGAILLIPMWLLLLIGILCVTAAGGLDGLGVARSIQFVFATTGTIAMAVLSFGFCMAPGRKWRERILTGIPVHAFPISTIVLIIVGLNPWLTARFSVLIYRLPWTVFATLSLIAALGFVVYQISRSIIRYASGILHSVRSRTQFSRAEVVSIETLDPETHFAELLRLAAYFESRHVRIAATERLRKHPRFPEALTSVLQSRDPTRGLEFLVAATISTEEQFLLAGPAKQGLEQFIDSLPPPHYMSSDRRKQLRRWGRKTFRRIATQFASTDVDFDTTLAAFEAALAPKR